MKNIILGSLLITAAIAAAIFDTGCTQTNLAGTHDGGRAEQKNADGSTDKPVAASVPTPKPRVAPKPKPEFCSRSTTLAFDGLRDFINDQKRHNGDCMVVTDAPRFTEVETMEDEYGNHKGLFVLKNDESTDVSVTFLSSPDLAKALKPLLKRDTPHVRVTSVRVQFSDEIEIFWSPYAIKVEGVDEAGQVMWTVTGKPPAKLKFPV